MPRYIYPPRPLTKIKPEQLGSMEKEDKYLWQPKFDGDRCVTSIQGGSVFLGNRHAKWHSPHAYPQIRQEVLGLNLPDGNHYLDGELVSFNNEAVLVLFDVLQIKSYLIGVNQAARISILEGLIKGGRPHPEVPATKMSEHLWIADHGYGDFDSNYSDFITNPLLEGLVLRKTESVLDNWGASEYEVDWQIRCRRPHKNYRF